MKQEKPTKRWWKTVVREHWPLVGWLTGGGMAATLWLGSEWLPYGVAVLLAMAVRMALTRGYHELGLAHFADGMVRHGRDRSTIVAAMSRKRAGVPGVLAVAVYCGALAVALYVLEPRHAALTVFAADPFARMLSSQIAMMLPYIPDGADSRLSVYRTMGVREGIILALEGLLPGLACCWLLGTEADWQLLIAVPCVVMYALYRVVAARLRGYTSSCRSACFLLCELAILLTAAYCMGLA